MQGSTPTVSESDGQLARYRADIDELENRLVTLHPRPFAYISETDFRALVASKRQSITADTSLRDLMWMFSEIIASIQCAHTNMGYFNQENRLVEPEERFPLQAMFLGDQLFVIDPLANADSAIAGDEILSINNIPVDEIREGIYNHISTDGGITGQKQAIANAYITAYIAYQMQFPEQYTVNIRGQRGEKKLVSLSAFDPAPLGAISPPCAGSLCAVQESSDLVVVKVGDFAFYGDRFTEYKSFLDAAFADVEARNVPAVVIDVRGNQGGPSYAAQYLLDKFVQVPFPYFAAESTLADLEQKLPSTPLDSAYRGKVVILADGATNSTTGHFLSLIKYHGIAPIVGSESGSTFTVNDASERFKSSASDISYKVATSVFTTAVEGFPRDQGILPDEPVALEISDILEGTDSQLARAVLLARSRSR